MKSHLALTLALVVFLPTAALAQSQDEQNACMNDAFQVCGHAIPDRDRVAACLSENFNRISHAVPAGDAAVFQRQVDNAGPARAGLRPLLKSAFLPVVGEKAIPRYPALLSTAVANWRTRRPLP